jgi:hypothetical protein
VTERARLLDVRETLSPADHQTHRRYVFDVPRGCEALQIAVRYGPKFVSDLESLALAEAALQRQTAALVPRVGALLAEQWATNLIQRAKSVRVSNLLTISLDDASGVYRGAGHRQSNDQRLFVRTDSASPGLEPGPIPPGTWSLTVSAHTLVSHQVDLSIQIGAETASSRP